MTSRRMVPGALVLSLALIASASAQEQKVKAKDVPAPVLAAVSKSFATANVKGWERDTKDGKTFYEAELVEGTAKRQAIFAADGTLVETEEMIAAASVPAAVTAAVKAKYPKATIQAAEKITRGSEIEYELGLKNAAKKEIVLAADGRILKEE